MDNISLDNKDAEIALLRKQKTALDDSIRYASYIQKAMLPSQIDLNRFFPNNFILNIPRDVVSGDFYWVYRVMNRLIFCVADCTGHGVPGAFMSMLGISALNQIILTHKDISAGNILDTLREYVMKSLNQTGHYGEMQDGMDISLCILDDNTNELQFSGAYNSLYIVRDGELIEYPSDRMPIGIAPMEEKAFSTQNITLKKDDMLYMFSDGFADQFGGAKGKKLKTNSFKKLLTEISPLEMSQQKDLLHKRFNEWMGQQRQIDDVMVMGIRHTKAN